MSANAPSGSDDTRHSEATPDAWTERWKSEEIKPVGIPLAGFQYLHTPRDEDSQSQAGDHDLGLVGRDDLLQELCSVLTKTHGHRGSYLLAGFRGAGKTTVMNNALALYNGSSDHLSWLHGEATGNALGPMELARLLESGHEKIDSINARNTRTRRQSTIGSWRGPLQLLRDCCRLRRQHHEVVHEYEQVLRGKPLEQGVVTRSRAWFVTSLRRLKHPLIHVRVNLATEKTLDARTVLFNTALLLDQQLRVVERRWPRRIWRYLGYITTLTFGMGLGYCGDACLDTVAGTLGADGTNIGIADALQSTAVVMLTFLFGSAKIAELSHTVGTHEQYLPHIPTIIGAIIVFGLWRYVFRTPQRLRRRLHRIVERGFQTEETNRSFNRVGFLFGAKTISPPLDAQQMEAALLAILDEARTVWPVFGRPDIVFVFDELDKISGSRPLTDPELGETGNDAPASATSAIYQRKARVDELLSTIKNFITEGQARFFFIAGREMLDSYQAERGNASSLYESLFNRVYEVPSLLTDPAPRPRGRIARLTEAFVCRRLLQPDIATYLWYENLRASGEVARTGHEEWIECGAMPKRWVQYKPYRLRTVFHWMVACGVEPAEARRIVFMLRHLVHFLVLHSWGNCKRLNSLFEHFIKPNATADWETFRTRDQLCSKPPQPGELMLQLGRMDQQRIMLASNLFVLVQHHLRRQHASGTDKLAVSVFAALQYLLKFHRYPFARSQLDRMDEVLSIHRSPELGTTIDTLLTLVMRPYIRMIRNGLSRYRFIHGFEQEIRYITRISDIESAAFNFSLDATVGVKNHYLQLLRDAESRHPDRPGPENGGSTTIADINITLGDLLAQEESFDQAAVHLQDAVDALTPYIEANHYQYGIKSILQYVEALLKLGDVNERRQRYDRAAAAYELAESIAAKLIRTRSKKFGRETDFVRDALYLGDSKWDILKQPLWALRYLNLKRSPIPWAESCVPKPAPFYKEEGICSDPVFHYRAGQVAFFYSQHNLAAEHFSTTVKLLGEDKIKPREENERASYLGGYATLGLAENLLIAFMQRQHKRIRLKVRGKQRRTFSSRRNDSIPKWDASYDFAEVSLVYLESVKTLLTPLSEIESEEDLLSFVSSNGTVNPEILDKLGRLSPTPSEALSENNLPIDSLQLTHVFGLVLHVARRFQRHGLNYHATIAYLKLLSLWACVVECLPLTLLSTHIDTREPEVAKEWAPVFRAIRDADRWLNKPRMDAIRCAQAVHGSAFAEIWYKIWYSDLPGWPQSEGDPRASRDVPNHLLDLKGLPMEPGARGRAMAMLGSCKPPSSDSIGNPDLNETPVWYSSLLFQKLTFVNIWQGMLCNRISSPSGNNPDLHFDPTPEVDFPAVGHMLPGSIRALLYAHWLGGRALAWKVIRGCDSLVEKSESSEISEPDFTKAKAEIYSLAGAAGHNLYRAHYYIRQMCGNDQDVMFPSPAMIFHALWRLIHCLVEHEPFLEHPPTKPGRDSCKGNNNQYACHVRHVRKRILANADSGTPGNYFDYGWVSEHLIGSLRDVEQLSDLSSRPRAEVLKGKYFLSDDYEDPRFHLDWSMIHILAPTAALIKDHVIHEKDRLRNLLNGPS